MHLTGSDLVSMTSSGTGAAAARETAAMDATAAPRTVDAAFRAWRHTLQCDEPLAFMRVQAEQAQPCRIVNPDGNKTDVRTLVVDQVGTNRYYLKMYYARPAQMSQKVLQ